MNYLIVSPINIQLVISHQAPFELEKFKYSIDLTDGSLMFAVRRKQTVVFRLGV